MTKFNRHNFLLLLYTLVAQQQIAYGVSVKSGIFGSSRAGEVKKINGKVPAVNNGEFPYMASIEIIANNTHICGAAVIRFNIALTSAHCTEGKTAAELQLRAGTYVSSDTKSESYQVKPLKRILAHPDHRKPTNHDFDIAIVWLQDNLEVSKYVKTIRLASDFENGEEAIILSYGWDENHEPQKRLKNDSLTTISNKRCNHYLKYKRSKVAHSMVCAVSLTRKVVGFTGDSGGLLVLQNWDHPEKSVLVGLVSWCVMDERQKQVVTYDTCSTNFPTMFANIAFMRNWILTQIATKPK